MKPKKQIERSVTESIEMLAGAKNVIIKATVFMLTTVFHNLVVVLRTPRSARDRIVNSYLIHDSINGNSWFPTPDPPLADFKALIKSYAAAATDAQAGAKDAEARLMTAWSELRLGRRMLVDYVQGVCLKNPSEAEAIAQSAALSVKRLSPGKKHEFTVRPSPDDKGVVLTGKPGGKRCLHEFQCTYDPADQLGWYKRIIPVTRRSKVTVTGLEQNKRVFFRHRCIVPDGPCEWDPVISVFIA